jgi:uncharacterized alpha-E superfamily protein
VLSRFAESFFWLSRNVERAETIARVLDVTWSRSMDLSAGDAWARRSWRTAYAVGTFTDVADADADDSTTTFQRCIFDPGNPSSIVSSVSVARANAIGVRAELSTETWENVNELYFDVQAQSMESLRAEGPSRFLRRVRDRCQAIAGVSDATLLHVDGWNFLQLGRFVERGYLAARMLATIGSLEDPWPEWQRLLEMCCARVPFARASSSLPTPSDAVAFILFDATFPRSLKFCANEVDAALHRISDTVPGRSFTNDAEKLAGRLCTTFNFTDLSDVLERGLGPFTADATAAIEGLLAAVQTVYFPRVPVAGVAAARSESFIA